MFYSKISRLHITIVTLATLFLVGCASLEHVEVEFVNCEGGSDGLERCEVRVVVETNSIGSGFDSGKLSMDTSQSTVGFVQNILNATLVQKRNGVIVGTLNFQFGQNGGGWYPVNTASLDAWVANNLADNDTIELGVSGLEFTSNPGMNVVVTELVYDNTVLAGASKSWYVSPQGGNQIMQ